MDQQKSNIQMVGDIAVTVSGALAKEADVPEIQAATEVAVNMAALIAQKLEEQGIHTEPNVTEVLKTNERAIGMNFRTDGDNVAPTIYPDKLLEDAQGSMDEAVTRGVESVKFGLSQKIEVPDLTIEEARQHIKLVLLNAEKNAELLAKTPHFDVAGGELAAIPRWQINEEASFVVSESLCSHIGITGDEALAFGQKNLEATEYKVQSMTDVMREMMGAEMFDMMPAMDSGPEMLVVTSPTKLQGASALLDEKTMQAVHERLGGDFVVLPSSIHEVICLPISDDMDPRDLRSMVQEVNGTQVRPEERLSDQVFRCDGHKLSLVGESLKPQMDEPKVEAPKMAQQQSMKFAM